MNQVNWEGTGTGFGTTFLTATFVGGSKYGTLSLNSYRALGLKRKGHARMYSRNGKDFSARFPSITRGFDGLPDETLIDEEVVGVDESGRPSLSTLRNFDLAPAFYAFDLPTVSGRRTDEADAR